MDHSVSVGDMVLSRTFIGHYCKVIDIRKPIFRKPNFYNMKYKVQDIFHSNKSAWCDYRKLVPLDADLSGYTRDDCWDGAGDFADRVFGEYSISFPISEYDESIITLPDPIMQLPEMAVAYFRHRNDHVNWINGILLSVESNHYLTYDILAAEFESKDEFDNVIDIIQKNWIYFLEYSKISRRNLPEKLPEYNYDTITRRK